jgi:hypothetical protein
MINFLSISGPSAIILKGVMFYFVLVFVEYPIPLKGYILTSVSPYFG